MFCPNCGQEQISQDTRFCSRCGLPLNIVAEVVLHGGFLPQLADASKNKKWLTRKNGLKFGLAWFLLVTFLLVPLAAIADAEEVAGALALLGFIGGLLMMLFSFLFLPKGAKTIFPAEMNQNYNTSPNYLYGNPQQNQLPPPQQQYAPPPANSWKAPDTGEFAKPGSVTEGTTKLLNRDD